MSLMGTKPGKALQITQEEFLRRCGKVHGDRYTYANAVYDGMRHKVRVTCAKHGDFEVTPMNHLYLASKCPECAGRPRNTARRQAQLGRHFVEKRRREQEDIDYRKRRMKERAFQ